MGDPGSEPATDQAAKVIAAVDLGSNSFHMIVARHEHGHFTVLDRLREMVRFGAGLDDRGRVSEEASERAMACLRRFGQRLRDMHADSVRAVGTNTFRRAKNAAVFLSDAEAALGHPIEIISGREEARLIYLGATHAAPSEGGRRLVIDIGGGSTEIIIGEGLKTKTLLSLYMGCVSISEEYFPGGKVTQKRMRRARLAARMELEPVSAGLKTLGWDEVVGTSGTIKATASILNQPPGPVRIVTLPGMESLAEKLISAGTARAADLPGLTSQREPVFAGGLAILMGLFEGLELDELRPVDGALREGLLYDLIGRQTGEDARQRTVRALQRRHQIDIAQAQRTENTAMRLFDSVAEDWKLAAQPFWENSLRFAARLHEVGLAMAHAQYHRHGAYLLENSELAGFSKQEQTRVSRLVLAHRRKVAPDIFDELPQKTRKVLPRLAVLLRLAVLFNRGRSDTQVPDLQVRANGRSVELVFPKGWLAGHPLSKADLEREVQYLKAIGFSLAFS